MLPAASPRSQGLLWLRIATTHALVAAGFQAGAIDSFWLAMQLWQPAH